MSLKFAIVVLVLLALLAAVGWKAWVYRTTALHAMAKVEAISERFTHIGWFEDENRRWLESGERPDVVFMGASITKGWSPEGKLGDIKVAARGVPGQWPTHYLLRLRPDVLELQPRAAVVKACAITFRPGVDEKGTYEVMLEIVDRMEKHGIVLATCEPVREDGNVIYHSDGSKSASGTNDRLLPFNDWLRGLAAERGYGLIDFHAEMAGADGFLPPELARDDIHPSPAGYERMTEIARAALEEILATEGLPTHE